VHFNFYSLLPHHQCMLAFVNLFFPMWPVMFIFWSMASKTRSNKTEDNASPYLTLLVMGNVNVYWYQLMVALEPAMVTPKSWTNFFGIPIIRRLFNILFLLTLSKACLKSMNKLFRCVLNSYTFSCVCLMVKMWSLVERFTQYPRWYSPSISSAYSINLLYKIPDNIL